MIQYWIIKSTFFKLFSSLDLTLFFLFHSSLSSLSLSLVWMKVFVCLEVNGSMLQLSLSSSSLLLLVCQEVFSLFITFFSQLSFFMNSSVESNGILIQENDHQSMFGHGDELQSSWTGSSMFTNHEKSDLNKRGREKVREGRKVRKRGRKREWKKEREERENEGATNFEL